jgi:hypothetical protein
VARRRVGPAPAHQFAMPPQQSGWRDQEGCPALSRQQLGQRGEDEPIGGGIAGPGDLPTQHQELVAQHGDLHVLRVRGWTESDQAENPPNDQEPQRPHHRDGPSFQGRHHAWSQPWRRSHLFLQAANSCEMLRRSEEARKQLHDLIRARSRSSSLAETICEKHASLLESGGLEVVFGFLGDWRGRTIVSLSLFSRISLVQESGKVANLAYRPSIALIGLEGSQLGVQLAGANG